MVWISAFFIVERNVKEIMSVSKSDAFLLIFSKRQTCIQRTPASSSFPCFSSPFLTLRTLHVTRQDFVHKCKSQSAKSSHPVNNKMVLKAGVYRLPSLIWLEFSYFVLLCRILDFPNLFRMLFMFPKVISLHPCPFLSLQDPPASSPVFRPPVSFCQELACGRPV